MAELNSRTRDLLRDHYQRKQDQEQRRKPDFQSPFEAVANLIQTLEETCSVHPDVHLQQFKGRTVCTACQREKLEAEETERSKRAAQRYEKRITYDRLCMDSILNDASLRDASFQSYLTDDEESKRNKEAARQIAGRYLKGETFNTLLSGNAGAGKSHLAMSILKAVNENSDPWKSCLFLTVDELLLQIRSTFGGNDKANTENEQTIIDRFAYVDLLVLDDLGSESAFFPGGKEDPQPDNRQRKPKQASDFTQRVLYNLMTKRQDKSTIITTNLDSIQMSAVYDQKIISRLYRRVEGNIIKFENSKDRRISRIQF